MVKASFLLLMACTACGLDTTLGYGFYPMSDPNSAGALLSYAPFSVILPPDCYKCKEEGESISSEGSSKEEKESGSSGKESKSSSEEGGESKGSNEEEGEKKEGEEKESGEKTEGEEKEGVEEKEGEEKEEGEKTEEKKEAPKKKISKETKYVFPPSYTFPARQIQQTMYSPVTSYNYLPYRGPYVIQQPSYLPRTSYQLVSLPSTGKSYSTASVASRIISRPLAKIMYSGSTLNYPQVSKTIVSPGARVYSSTPITWTTPVRYYKK